MKNLKKAKKPMNKIFKWIGLGAVGYWIVSGVGNNIAERVRFGFKSIRFIDFTKNILKFLLDIELTMSIENRHQNLNLSVIEFNGFLTYENQNISDINQQFAVEIKPRTRQPIVFRIKTDILEAAASLFLSARRRAKNGIIQGARIEGTLIVELDGLRFPILYNEPVGITL